MKAQKRRPCILLCAPAAQGVVSNVSNFAENLARKGRNEGRKSRQKDLGKLTCKDEAAGLCNAVLTQGLEPHGIANETEKDGHHDETPQPAHMLLYLQHTNRGCAAEL